jgi:hypothetical protein
MGDYFAGHVATSEWLDEYISDKAQELIDEKERIAIEANNVLIHDLQNVTSVIVKKYPFLVSFMDEHGCINISESDIHKSDIDALNVTWYMRYYELDHHGIRYFIVSNNWEEIKEVPWRVGGDFEFEPDIIIDYKAMTVNQAIDESSEFLITHMDDADINQRHMVISKLV